MKRAQKRLILDSVEITGSQEAGRLSFPLPIYTSIPLADASNDDGDEFEIVVGLDRKTAAEIKKYSLDESDQELQKNTSDRRRFGEGSYEKWYAKNRTPFGLIHKKTGALAALVWLGPKPLGQKSLRFLQEEKPSEKETKQDAGEWYTFVYRSYKPFRGKGLMKDFARFAMKIYSREYPDARYWVGTNPQNKAGIALASSLGFTVFEENSDRAAGWLVMIK